MIETIHDNLKAIDFNREMGITLAEFFRTLSSVVTRQPIKLNNGEALIADGHRRLVIRPSNTRKRVIGSLQLPVTDINFQFLGYSEAEAKECMARLDLYFRRGGG